MDIHTPLSLARACPKNKLQHDDDVLFVGTHNDQREIYIRIRRTACLLHFVLVAHSSFSRGGKQDKKKARLHNCMTRKTLFIYLQRKKSFLFPQRPFCTLQRKALYYILFPYIYAHVERGSRFTMRFFSFRCQYIIIW